MRSVCVFCGSNTGAGEEYAGAARALARALARRGLRLVYGGGSIGLMGVLGDAALAAGCHVVGVTPRRLLEKEVVHKGLTELRVVETMHERKALMEDLSGGFVALPGGFGTYDELFEMLTWGQLSVHSKPIGLLNVDGFFDPLLAMIRHGVAEGFVAEGNLQLFVVAATIDELLARMNAYRPAPVNKWLSHDRI